MTAHLQWFLLEHFPRLHFSYLLALLAVTLYLGVRLWREARQGRVPRVAWWNLPGLLALLYAPVQEQPTFFALGAFALLVAEYWPGAYRLARQRPGRWWPALGFSLGLALLVRAMQQPGVPHLIPFVGLTLLLAGGVQLLVSSGWRSQQGVAFTPPVWPRWAKVSTPDYPDLSITLTGNGAELKNISTTALALSGWSPNHLNAWLMIRDHQGDLLSTLKVGETALLPLNDTVSGVRVWYSAAGRTEAQLFRADWTPAHQQGRRILN